MRNRKKAIAFNMAVGSSTYLLGKVFTELWGAKGMILLIVLAVFWLAYACFAIMEETR